MTSWVSNIGSRLCNRSEWQGFPANLPITPAEGNSVYTMRFGVTRPRLEPVLGRTAPAREITPDSRGNETVFEFGAALGEGAAVFERASDGYVIRVFEIATQRHPGSDARDCDFDVAEAIRDVVRRGVALGIRVGRENHLGNVLAACAALEFADAELVGADAVDRGKRSAEHVIVAAEAAAALDGHQIGGLLDDTDVGAIPACIAADAARRGVREVEAFLAEDRVALQARDGVAEFGEQLVGSAKQEEGQPRGRLLADPGKSLQAFNEAIDGG